MSKRGRPSKIAARSAFGSLNSVDSFSDFFDDFQLKRPKKSSIRTLGLHDNVNSKEFDKSPVELSKIQKQVIHEATRILVQAVLSINYRSEYSSMIADADDIFKDLYKSTLFESWCKASVPASLYHCDLIYGLCSEAVEVSKSLKEGGFKGFTNSDIDMMQFSSLKSYANRYVADAKCYKYAEFSVENYTDTKKVGMVYIQW